jgi:S-adenosylmethionine hydrolase
LLSPAPPLGELGTLVETLRDLPWPEPTRDGDTVVGQVLASDTYGNLITNLRLEDLPGSPHFEIAGQQISGLSPHFRAQTGLLAVLGSSELVELALPNGSAAAELKVGVGAPVRVSPQ